MAAAITVTPSSGIVGTKFVVAGTGFGATAACTVKFRSPESTIDTVVKVTAAGGAISTSTLADIVPQAPGTYTVTVSDGTSTVSQLVNVYAT